MLVGLYFLMLVFYFYGVLGLYDGDAVGPLEDGKCGSAES